MGSRVIEVVYKAPTEGCNAKSASPCYKATPMHTHQGTGASVAKCASNLAREAAAALGSSLHAATAKVW